MRFDDLMMTIDKEQKMTVCILESNLTDVKYKISGNNESILEMLSDSFMKKLVGSISARDTNVIWVWLEDKEL